MVRDLTKDYAGTLQAVAGAGLVPSDPLQHSPTVLEFLAHEGGGAFAAHARSSMLLLTLPDVDGATRALACCRAIVAFVMRERRPGELADVAAGDVLRSCIEARGAGGVSCVMGLAHGLCGCIARSPTD